jgi:chemotaxis family two-component system response regulator Rcp1
VIDVPEILLIDDDLSDIRLIVEALRIARIRHSLNVAQDGDEAMAFLHQKGRFAHAPRPDLILLDLNLPKKYGRGVLAEIKGDPNLRRIPVVILTTSESEPNVLSSYDLHANAYIVKSPNLPEFIKVIEITMAFWLGIARLPPR